MTATIHKDRDGRWDPNNLWPTVKAIVDGMVEAGVLVDDDHKHLIGPDMRRGEKGEPRIVLNMHQVSAECEGHAHNFIQQGT
jgi:crossover junction endodeoxyribonuclease RusA